MTQYMGLAPDRIVHMTKSYRDSDLRLDRIMTDSARARFDVLTRGATIFAAARLASDGYILLALDQDGVLQQINIGDDQDGGIHMHPIRLGDTNGLIHDLSHASLVSAGVGEIRVALGSAVSMDATQANARSIALDCEIAAREAIKVLHGMQSSIKAGNVRSEIAMDLRFLAEDYESRSH